MRFVIIILAATMLLTLSGCYQIACSVFTDQGAHNCWGEGYNG